jgi:3-deoxy-D-arabino-heptulosonate 7-phosphate (DAHP) synthase class II
MLIPVLILLIPSISCFRSAGMEKKGEVELPSYRGDIINGPEFTPEARIPDPHRLVRSGPP